MRDLVAALSPLSKMSNSDEERMEAIESMYALVQGSRQQQASGASERFHSVESSIPVLSESVASQQAVGARPLAVESLA